MYSGTNIKAIQSQKWLAEALISLMAEKDYRKITVKDICKQADLSRQTFYNVFDSKDEILHFYLQNSYSNSFARIKDHTTLSAEDIVTTFIEVIEQNLLLLENMTQNQLTGILAEEIVSGVDLFTDTFVSVNQRDETFPYNKAMVSGAFSQVLIYWLKQKHPLDIHILSTLLTDFLQGKAYVFRPA